jgi:predicted anti-sigma-YlaC factor YlaD
VLKLGVPEVIGSTPLPRRLALVTAARLLLLSVALALVGAFYLRGKLVSDSFTLRTVIWAFGASFLVAGV